MKNGGIDKRVIKTKNAIFEAFKQLVQEKDMSDITISELTQKANITRSTFYMYYDTVGDVRTDIENEIIARIDKIMSEADMVEVMKSPYTLLSTLADEIAKLGLENYLIVGKGENAKAISNQSKIMSDIFEAVIGAIYLDSKDIDLAEKFILDKINERIVAAYMHRLAETTDKNLDMGKVRYVIAFAAAGITECFKIWFNHKSTITLEELCKHISDAVSKGVDWVSVTKAQN